MNTNPVPDVYRTSESSENEEYKDDNDDDYDKEKKPSFENIKKILMSEAIFSRSAQTGDEN